MLRSVPFFVVTLVTGLSEAIPTIRSKIRDNKNEVGLRRSLHENSITSFLADSLGGHFSRQLKAGVVVVTKVDLDVPWDGDEFYTLFLPKHDAFEALDTDFLEQIYSPQWTLHLYDLLLYHATEGFLYSEDLSDGMLVPMLNDDFVTFNRGAVDSPFPGSLLTPYNQTVSVIFVDANTFHGVVHRIDSVLLPYWYYHDVAEVLSDRGNFGKLLTALQLTGLGKILRNMNEVTILAPSNAAFAKLPEGTIENMSDEELVNMLSYHVLDGIIPAYELETGYVTPLNGDRIWVTVDYIDEGTGSIMFNDATVVEVNLLANNGIIHVIDTVLIPTENPATTEPTLEPCDWWDLFCRFEREDGGDGDW